MAEAPRAIANDLAESVRDFLHILNESARMGQPMEDLVTYGMATRARTRLAALEDSLDQKCDGDHD